MLCLVVLALISAPVFGGAVDLAKSSGVQGGIIVHLGCGDGTETAKLLLNERYLVHGLDASAANVAAARKTIMAAGLYGKVSVCTFDGQTLPYTNDLINLVIDSTGTVDRRGDHARPGPRRRGVHRRQEGRQASPGGHRRVEPLS